MKYLPPLQLAGVRFFISGLLLIPVYGNLKKYLRIFREHAGFMIWVAFLQTFLMYSFFYTGLNMVPGSLGAMVIGSGPLFVALVAHFFIPDDKMTWKLTGGMFLAIVGIVIINFGRHVTGIAGPKEILGVFILILNNIVGGIYNVVVMKSKRDIPPVVLSSVSLGVGGIALFLFSLPVEGFKIESFPPEFYAALAWLSMLSAVAFSIWFTLLKRPGVKLSGLNTWKFLIPVVGAALSWLLIPGESPDIYAITGMLVVGISLLVLNHEAIFKNVLKSKMLNQ